VARVNAVGELVERRAEDFVEWQKHVPLAGNTKTDADFAAGVHVKAEQRGATGVELLDDPHTPTASRQQYPRALQNVVHVGLRQSVVLPPKGGGGSNEGELSQKGARHGDEKNTRSALSLGLEYSFLLLPLARRHAFRDAIAQAPAFSLAPEKRRAEEGVGGGGEHIKEKAQEENEKEKMRYPTQGHSLTAASTCAPMKAKEPRLARSQLRSVFLLLVKASY
jgi:hypothetical protein